jgi:S1-C subfamily serine protease
VTFTEYDVSRDRQAAEEMVRMTGQMGVPVIVINGEAIIGFDRERIRALLADSSEHKPIRFGLKIADAGKNGAGATSGALVGAVTPGYLGEKAGLKAGDIITNINSKRINCAADVEQALKHLKSGKVVTILFRRNGENRRSEIVVQ